MTDQNQDDPEAHGKMTLDSGLPWPPEGHTANAKLDPKAVGRGAASIPISLTIGAIFVTIGFYAIVNALSFAVLIGRNETGLGVRAFALTGLALAAWYLLRKGQDWLIQKRWAFLLGMRGIIPRWLARRAKKEEEAA